MAKGRKRKRQVKEPRQTESAAPPVTEIAILRRRARWRSMLVPGAGLWELGLSRAGWAAYAVAVAAIFCCLAFVLFACTPTFWAAVVSVVAYLIVSTVEYSVVSRAVPRTQQAPPPRRFPMALMTLLAGCALVLLALLRYDGRYVIEDDSMAPQLREGDSLFFSRFLPTWDLKRGTAVAYAVEEGNHRDAALARVIGLPGDQISREGGRYVINGRISPFAAATVLGRTTAVNVPYHPQSIEVPPGHYFLAADTSIHGKDSQTLGWIPGPRIISSRMLLFNRWSWGKSLHRPWEPSGRRNNQQE